MAPPSARRTNYVIRGGVEGRERLRVLSRINRQSTLGLLERAGIRPGMACLDIGCGGGDVSFDIARLIEPGGTVLGMDFDEVKIDMARAEAQAAHIANIEFRVADIDEYELPPGFDLAHVRFVLSHLPDPKKVLTKIWNALRPGGVIVVADSDWSGYFSEPDSPFVRRHVELYTQAVKRRGGDPNIGPRLPALLTQSGFGNVHMNVVQHAGTEGEVKLITPITAENTAEAIIDEGLASRVDLDGMVSELYAFARDPNTVLSGPRIIQTWAHRPV